MPVSGLHSPQPLLFRLLAKDLTFSFRINGNHYKNLIQIPSTKSVNLIASAPVLVSSTLTDKPSERKVSAGCSYFLNFTNYSVCSSLASTPLHNYYCLPKATRSSEPILVFTSTALYTIAYSVLEVFFVFSLPCFLSFYFSPFSFFKVSIWVSLLDLKCLYFPEFHFDPLFILYIFPGLSHPQVTYSRMASTLVFNQTFS